MMFPQALPVSAGPSSSSRGTAVTSGGGAGTFTATPVQLIASTDYDSAGFFLHMIGGSVARRELRLYVGGSGSETEICTVPALPSATIAGSTFFPIFLPAGSRVSMAAAASSATQTMYAHLTLVRGTCGQEALASYGRIGGYTSGDAPDVDAGASANTKGSWVEIVASTTNDAKGYTVMLMSDPSIDTANQMLFDIGVGGSGSEQIIAADLFLYGDSFRAHGQAVGPFWTPIPAGSRLAARVQSSTDGANARIPKVAFVFWE